jgi:hypothetical protein
MFYLRASVFQEGRKTLQSYKLILNLQNFSSFFFEVFFRATLKPSSNFRCQNAGLIAIISLPNFVLLKLRQQPCSATALASVEPPSQKRVQSYAFSSFPPNFSTTFFMEMCRHTPLQRLFDTFTR